MVTTTKSKSQQMDFGSDALVAGEIDVTQAHIGGVTLTGAELGVLDGVGSTVTVAQAAGGANNEIDVTVTVKNAAGATVAAVHNLELWFSESAVGAGLTADTYSGSLVAETGAILTTLTAKKHFVVATAATGIFAGVLTDSNEPVDQYVVVKKPIGGGVVVSTITATWG